MSVPPIVRRYIPTTVFKLRDYWRYARARRHFKNLFREKPIGEAFAEIYRSKAWGGSPDENFNSGEGSGSRFGEVYARFVNQFVAEKNLHHIVDLGCGDYRVGRLLHTSSDVRYTGVDVVADLIRHHQEHFQSPYVDFRCANIIDDELPDGDFCLIRQVLQHLSNAQIAKVLATARSKYRYLLITEGLYVGPKSRPNLDKPAGWDTREYDRSGVFLELPPFSLPVETVLEMPLADNSVLRTMLLERAHAAAAR